MAGYYFKAFDWSLSTEDPYLVAQIAAPTCSTCQRLVRSLRSVHEKHQTIVGGHIAIQRLEIVTGKFRFKSDFVVEVHLTQGAETLTALSAPPSRIQSVTHVVSLVFISWLNGALKIVEVGAPG